MDWFADRTICDRRPAEGSRLLGVAGRRLTEEKGQAVVDRALRDGDRVNYLRDAGDPNFPPKARQAAMARLARWLG